MTTGERVIVMVLGAAASLFAQSSPSQVPASPATATGASAPAPRAHSQYLPSRFSKRAHMYYQGAWGVDSLSVKAVESGQLIRFSWRVVEPDRAKPLHDKKLEPSLIDLRAGVKLVVPSLEKVGQLRQAGAPEAGRSYWMAFSNRGRLVKPGDRVNVVIGSFHADGLVVE